MALLGPLYAAIRRKFSGDKTRFDDGRWSLDLTYITDRVVAMAFPGDGVESTYRNWIDDVAAMLEHYHSGHYMIFNLSGRDYDYAKLRNNVQSWCAFPDHHPPPLGILLRVLQQIHRWLLADPLNIVIAHCLAGKGRTGTIIASYLMYAGLFDNADDALNYFACKRSLTINGVTVPGQRRYVGYVHSLVVKQQRPHHNAFFISNIVLNGAPHCSLGMGSGSGIVPSLSVFSVTGRREIVFNSLWTGPAPVFEEGKGPITFKINKVVRGDVLVTIEHLPPFGRAEQVLRFSFHTGFIPTDSASVVFRKVDLDNADVDPRFSNEFALEVFIQPPELNVVEQERFSREIDEEDALIDAALARTPPIDGTLCWIDPALDGSLAPNLAAKVGQARCECGTQLQGAYIEKSGWLVKQGHQVRNWKRRWFVLRETLAYFKSPKSTVPCGTIRLADICRVVSDPAVPDATHLHCFEIIVMPNSGQQDAASGSGGSGGPQAPSPSTSPPAPQVRPVVPYLICAIDERQKEEWVEAIEVARMERKMPESPMLDRRGSRMTVGRI